jgi:hypothetical protein
MQIVIHFPSFKGYDVFLTIIKVSVELRELTLPISVLC